MINIRRHSLLVAATFSLACLLLAHAGSDDGGNIVKPNPSALQSATEVVEAQSAWWKALLHVKWLPEIAALAFICLYVSNIWFGRAQNTEIAVAFASTFCTEGALLDRNFSQVGPRLQGAKDSILRESMNKFNVFATGRRFCQSFQATLDLKHRQDLLYMLFYWISPREDHIDIDIPMNESNMQPLVLVVATPKLARDLSKALPDVQSLTRPIEVERKRLPGFPSDKLSVWAESSSVFYDLITDKITELLFGRAAFQEASIYFRYLHFSSENPEGFSKHNLRFSFNLPPKEHMEDLTKILTAVLHFIDVSSFVTK